MWERVQRSASGAERSGAARGVGGASARIFPGRARGRGPVRRGGERRLARDEGWHFVQLGLFLERAAGRRVSSRARCERPGPRLDPTTALDEQLEWIGLLRACDALELYRRRCGAELQPDRIVRFLIADPLSPRSVRYALDEIARALAALAAAVPNQPPDRPGLRPDVSCRLGPSPAAPIRSPRCRPSRPNATAFTARCMRPISIIGARPPPVAPEGAPWTTR